MIVLLALFGAGLVGAALRPAPPPAALPPQPLAEAAPTDLGNAAGIPAPDPVALPGNDPSATTDPSATAHPASTPPPSLPRSAPTTITIPAIGVNAPIMTLGLNPDGTVQVPPLDQAQNAGWYSPGPSPGELGNAVIVGHVDSAKIGPAVFFQLGALKPGNTITVNRQDGTAANFRVDGVKSYPKAAFPSELVYGPADQASLRVVTCGGQFDQTNRSYVDNVIVFATLIT